MHRVVMANSTDLLTASQVATLIPVHVETVRRWTREGRIASITLPSGRKRYRRSDVEQLLQRGAA